MCEGIKMTDRYDLVVIGAGSAGLTAANFAGGLGRKVALVERERLGGDCTWDGCVPSKALIKTAKVAHAMRTANRFGIQANEPQIDMKAVRDYVQSAIQEVYQHETPQEIEKRDVDVILGEARFLDANTLRVNERQLNFKKAIIATGARPTIPPIPGLDQVNYLTNRNLFENDRLPDHLLIMGAGPIGMEMAQAYARLGSKVTVVGDEIMERDEPKAVEVLLRVFEREGIRVIKSLVEKVEKSGENGQKITLSLKNGDTITGDMLLVAVGRTPNTESLDLDKAGVKVGKDGIEINDYLQTSAPHIYAVGDVTDGPKFTHYAGMQGSIAARNAIFPIVNFKGKWKNVPWVTFTEPEIAHYGDTIEQARREHGDSIKVFTLPFTEGDRAVAEGDTEGFVTLIYKDRNDFLGVTIVGERAGEMLLELQLVVGRKISLSKLVGTMHAYPTYSEIAQKILARITVKELLSGFTGRAARTLLKVLPG
jgi:pyruvate/2-oxoglutarate dehydrogenase complex dihydrolipoamide dehydrogenase (E3) component